MIHNDADPLPASNRDTKLGAGFPVKCDDIPVAYRGLDRFEARKLIVADLEAAGLLVETSRTACRCRAATAAAR